MTRTNFIISTAAALGGTMLFASSAQACISCEYVPEVLNASKDHGHRSSSSSYSATMEMRAQAARAQMAKAQMLKAQAAKAQMAKAMAAKARAAAAKKVETASLQQNANEPAAKTPEVKAVSTKAAASGSGTIREKVVSTATLLVSERASAESAPSEPVGCKKFIAAIGTTVTVPCK